MKAGWSALVVLLAIAAGCDPAGGGRPSDPGVPNRWPAHQAPHGLVPGDWEVGHVLPDVALNDQYGDPVELWQFWDRDVVLSFSAMWCLPCRELASQLDAVIAGVNVPPDSVGAGPSVLSVTVLQQDGSGLAVSSDEAAEWATEVGVGGPVLADTDGDTVEAVHGSFPRVLLVDRRLTVAGTCDPPTPEALADEIRALLDSESP